MLYKESLKRWIKHTEDNNRLSYLEYVNYLFNSKLITPFQKDHFTMLYTNQLNLIKTYCNTQFTNKRFNNNSYENINNRIKE